MIQKCALTKLAYLLSKSDRLPPDQIRKLICVPLRGEITLPPRGSTDHPSSDLTPEETTESLPNILRQIASLSSSPPAIPTIQVSKAEVSGTSPAVNSLSPPRALTRSTSLSQIAKEATSPWSNTISETASTERALLPFLVHLAVVRDDTDALRFCFDTSSDAVHDATPMAQPTWSPFFSGDLEVPQTLNLGLSGRGVVGGIVNVLDQASGRTPLHVAALNGSKKCAILLLESGALVHLRDALDHTALYYVSDQFRTLGQLTHRSIGAQAARQGHETIVNHLVQAGAHPGGSDFTFMRVAIRKALHLGDQTALGIWKRVGVEFNEVVNLTDLPDSPTVSLKPVQLPQHSKEAE
jgi:lysophospholipase